MDNSSGTRAWQPWQELRGIRLEPMLMNLGPIDPGANFSTAAHPFYTWWWLDKGSVTLTTDRGKTVVPAKHWVLIPVGLRRHQQFSADAVINSINFAARWPNGLPLLRFSGLVIHKAKSDNALIEAALRAHREAATPFSSRFVLLEKRHLSLESGIRLMAELARFVARLLEQPSLRDTAQCAPATGDSRLDLVLDHLSRNLRAGPLPYDAWKRVAGISRPQLDRLAQASLGYSLREHRDHLLLAEIHRRLSIDQSSLKRHAMELGFVDPSHFGHWVKRRSGRTPKLLAAFPA